MELLELLTILTVEDRIKKRYTFIIFKKCKILEKKKKMSKGIF